jgi:hypothetical protein
MDIYALDIKNNKEDLSKFILDYDDGQNTDNLTVVVMKTEGYTFKEIGEKFGKDYHWASSRYNRGVKYIRNIINEY